MSLLIAKNIGKSWGAETVLADVNLRLEWHQRVGLVGPNGSGKTTLLRILAGALEPDRGTVSVARGIRVSLLEQIQQPRLGATVWQEAERAQAELLALEERMRQYEAAMAHETGGQLEVILEEYAALRDRYEAMGGYDAARDLGRVLRAMGFAESDFHRQASQLSGGQKTRLALARMVLAGTEVLLLDEPTNHLDLDATEWLEGYLNNFGGALIVVSHDRRFLDNVVNSIAELDNGRLTRYRGNFTAYWNIRAEKLRDAEENERRRQEEITRLEEFWRKNKAGQNRNLAWSRYKAAERLRAQSTSGPSRFQALKASVQSRQRSGNEVVLVERLGKRFGDRMLFHDFTMLLTRGQRVGVIGPNGSGKTTFLRIVLGLEAPSEGTVRMGASVIPGYFAQEGADLETDLSVLEALLDIQDMPPAEARSFLARWQFTGDAVFKQVGQLSGGERNRLALARLALLKPNLLVLDEPTNHLDIVAREALTDMLRTYDGTLILASHDRYLLDEVTTHTLEIADGEARLYEGAYSAWKQSHERELQGAAHRQTKETATAAEKPRTSFELSRLRRQALRDVSRAEQRVQEAEDWVRRLEECLSHPEPSDDVVRLAAEYEQAQDELAQAMAEWEAAMTRAESLSVSL